MGILERQLLGIPTQLGVPGKTFFLGSSCPHTISLGEMILSSAGPCTPHWIQFTALFSTKQMKTCLSIQRREASSPSVHKQASVILRSSILFQRRNQLLFTRVVTGMTSLIISSVPTQAIPSTWYQLKLLHTPLLIFQGFLVCQFKPAPSCYF